MSQAPSQLLPSPAKANVKGKLVPKKSKLALRALGLGSSSSANVNASSVGKEKGRDLSDVVRRVGASATASSSGREIWVECTEEDVSVAVEEEAASLVILKKGRKKERAALGDVGWGTNGAGSGDRNPEKAGTKEKEKERGGAKEKWWTLGLGKGKNMKENAISERSKCESSSVLSSCSQD